MNLIEFSKISNQSIDNLKELLMIQFNRIVLSEYVGLDEKVLHELMDYFGINQIDSVSHTDLPEEILKSRDFLRNQPMKSSASENYPIFFTRK